MTKDEETNLSPNQRVFQAKKAFDLEKAWFLNWEVLLCLKETQLKENELSLKKNE